MFFRTIRLDFFAWKWGKDVLKLGFTADLSGDKPSSASSSVHKAYLISPTHNSIRI